MKDKKEIQDTIVKQNGMTNVMREEELLGILRMIAPGTNLRSALDGALKTGKGALIAIENDLLLPILDRGFRINARFTPQRMIELSKMDGAIVLSKDMKKINYANVLLTPDSKISTNETGTRHIAAERTAKQTGTLVIAISERKHEITLYYKKLRYPVVATDHLLRKTNEQVQILEKQREDFDNAVKKLDYSELRNHNSLEQALLALQRGVLIKKISGDLQKNVIELGKEGILQKTRLKEITRGIERETDLMIKDYTMVDMWRSKTVLDGCTYDEILSFPTILRAMGYEEGQTAEKVKGWRILSKTSLSEAEIAALIKETNGLGRAIHSGFSLYQTIFGLDRAQVFIQELSKIKLNFNGD